MNIRVSKALNYVLLILTSFIPSVKIIVNLSVKQHNFPFINPLVTLNIIVNYMFTFSSLNLG